MANSNSYADKINILLEQMPDFVTEFIYNFNDIDKLGTKFEYTRDIQNFFEFLINFIPEFSEKNLKELSLSDLDSIDALTVNKYLTTLSKQGKAKRTIKRRRAAISSLYTYYTNTGKISHHVVAASRKIKLEHEDLIYLTNEEQASLLSCVRTGEGLPEKKEKYHERYAERDSAIVILLLDTGLRVSELAGTDIADYNFDKCSVGVIRKGGDHQTVYFSDECAGYLEEYFDMQMERYKLKNDNFPAFTNLQGKRLSVRSIERLVKKYAYASVPEKAKKITPHKLRSSFAMSFYQASGHDILKLQKKLNHKSISTTNIYAKASDSDMEDTRNLLQGKR